MKGTIAKATKMLIEKKFGIKIWEQILIDAGYPNDHVFLIRDDINDEDIFKIFDSIKNITGLNDAQIFNAFAEFWVLEYLDLVYPAFKYNNAKDFILALDEIHEVMADSIPNSKPPRFDYKWLSDNELQVTYKSYRNLIDLVVLIFQALNKKYDDKIEVEKLNEKDIKITFI